MKLTGKFRLVVEGDTQKAMTTARDRRTLEYLLGRLVTGQPVAESELASWGLTVLDADPDEEFVRIPRLAD